MPEKNKSYKEEFAKFFESPSREGLRELLRGQIGELNNFDFKAQWSAYSKIARHILGLANSQGGCLIIGVEEKNDKTFDPVGVANLIDKADIYKGTQKYLPSQLKYDVHNFAYEDSEYSKLVGKKFQVVLVEDMPKYAPFISRADGDGIRENAIYTRRGTSTEESNYEELQHIINRRIETSYSSRGEFDLNKHLSELKSLYSNIDFIYNPFEEDYLTSPEYEQYEQNPLYPKESFEQFVRRMLDKKKQFIENTLITG